jgi:hypothetical protein
MNGGNMSEVTSRAQLIDASGFDARSQLAATLPREEIEEALRVKEVPELVLDIDRRSNGDVEAHTLRVAWTGDQLEELLRDTRDGEDITLYFDADELQQALADEDIEAHGMREKTAAVLTVAAIAAGAGAAAHSASADVGGGGVGAGSNIEMISDAASSGVAAAPELISDAASSGVAEAPELISDAASSGVAEAPELISDSASSGPSGIQVAESSGPELISDAASGPGVQVAESSGPELISDAASGPGVRLAESSGPELISDAASGPGVRVAESSGPELISDAASTGTPSPAQSTELAGVPIAGSDSGMSTSEIAETAAGAGLALMIAAAGFAFRGKRGREQPA